MEPDQSHHVGRSKAAANAGTTAKFSLPSTQEPVFFYGANNPYGWLSQMHPSKFERAGLTFNCNEKYMQYAKAALFEDKTAMQRILAESDPKKQKALGRRVKNFDSALWEEEAYKVVLSANYLKFTVSEHSEKLRGWLMKTGTLVLAEASPKDKIWGIGLSIDQAKKKVGKWPGKNLLGQAIMRVREECVRMIQAETERATGKKAAVAVVRPSANLLKDVAQASTKESVADMLADSEVDAEGESDYECYEALSKTTAEEAFSRKANVSPPSSYDDGNSRFKHTAVGKLFGNSPMNRNALLNGDGSLGERAGGDEESVESFPSIAAQGMEGLPSIKRRRIG